MSTSSPTSAAVSSVATCLYPQTPIISHHSQETSTGSGDFLISHISQGQSHGFHCPFSMAANIVFVVLYRGYQAGRFPTSTGKSQFPLFHRPPTPSPALPQTPSPPTRKISLLQRAWSHSTVKFTRPSASLWKDGRQPKTMVKWKWKESPFLAPQVTWVILCLRTGIRH